RARSAWRAGNACASRRRRPDDREDAGAGLAPLAVMEILLVHIALLAYAAGAAAFLAWLVRPVPRRAQAGRWLLLAGVVIHLGAFTLSLGLAGLGLGVLTWKIGQLFSLLAGAIVAVYLMLDRGGRMPVAGAVVAPPT